MSKSNKFDFSNEKYLSLAGRDFGAVKNLKLPKNADFLDLSHTVLPAGVYDFSGVRRLILQSVYTATKYSHHRFKVYCTA